MQLKKWNQKKYRPVMIRSKCCKAVVESGQCNQCNKPCKVV